MRLGLPGLPGLSKSLSAAKSKVGNTASAVACARRFLTGHQSEDEFAGSQIPLIKGRHRKRIGSVWKFALFISVHLLFPYIPLQSYYMMQARQCHAVESSEPQNPYYSARQCQAALKEETVSRKLFTSDSRLNISAFFFLSLFPHPVYVCGSIFMRSQAHVPKKVRLIFLLAHSW